MLGLLGAQGLTLSVAESLSGGMVASRISAVTDAADVFRGGIVAHDNAVKFNQLGVPEGPVVNAQVAIAMADGVRKLFGTDVGLATVGVAGPDEEEAQPVGTVYIGVALGEDIDARHLRLPGDRERIRQYSVISLLDLLRRKLIGADHETFAEVKQ